MGSKTKKMRKSSRKLHKTRRTKAKGVGNNIYKNANIFWRDPLEIKRNGRRTDLLDLIVNLDSSKNEWRQLKINLAKLAAFDLTVPLEQQSHSDEIITRLQKRGLRLKIKE